MWRKEEMDEKLETDQVVSELKQDQGERSLREYATSLGVSASYLSQVYNGVRPPSENLVAHLDLKPKTIYVRTRRWK
jgi:lambda repressor-like predicted transcriptional regulator